MTAETPATPGGRDARLAHVIVTIFGLCARAEGNWLPTASVVALMADLGAEPQAVRSSVSRLKRRGVLLSAHHRKAPGYSLSEPTLEALAEGDVRIFQHARASEEDGWVLVVFSVPEAERDKRYALRSNLTRLGFGTASPGVWNAPGTLAREARDTLERRGLADYVDIFTGQHIAFGDLRAKIPQWWNLDELTDLYTDFLQHYRPMLYRAAVGKPTPREAFEIYVPMLLGVDIDVDRGLGQVDTGDPAVEPVRQGLQQLLEPLLDSRIPLHGHRAGRAGGGPVVVGLRGSAARVFRIGQHIARQSCRRLEETVLNLDEQLLAQCPHLPQNLLDSREVVAPLRLLQRRPRDHDLHPVDIGPLQQRRGVGVEIAEGGVEVVHRPSSLRRGRHAAPAGSHPHGRKRGDASRDEPAPCRPRGSPRPVCTLRIGLSHAHQCGRRVLTKNENRGEPGDEPPRVRLPAAIGNGARLGGVAGTAVWHMGIRPQGADVVDRAGWAARHCRPVSMTGRSGCGRKGVGVR
ncbi:PaaX family transcriptional regulator C-terminal domain-containing protein [Nocardia seriolae]|uniref:PaaX family transcriptional regulator C-terminal domain-containing protein n=1 Tax=Nocardia seriolae TaxID=37332 RepID=UPI001E599C84|nr:PaaX family transcriptional regulator C-terminal domain-containing protein [Nocardia seriolae]